jgi:hypothetical protein
MWEADPVCVLETFTLTEGVTNKQPPDYEHSAGDALQRQIWPREDRYSRIAVSPRPFIPARRDRFAFKTSEALMTVSRRVFHSGASHHEGSRVTRAHEFVGTGSGIGKSFSGETVSGPVDANINVQSLQGVGTQESGRRVMLPTASFFPTAVMNSDELDDARHVADRRKRVRASDENQRAK